MAHSNISKSDGIVAGGTATDSHQEHPLKVYFIVWGFLFILSLGSYMVDFAGLQGYTRWSLILFFMFVKAGLIMAIFMHMKWERLSLNYAIILPLFAILVFIGIMAFEADYTRATRIEFFNADQ